MQLAASFHLSNGRNVIFSRYLEKRLETQGHPEKFAGPGQNLTWVVVFILYLFNNFANITTILLRSLAGYPQQLVPITAGPK